MTPLRRAFHILFAGTVYLLGLPLALMPLRPALRFGATLGRIGFSLWRSRARVAVENIRLVQSKGYLKGRSPEDIARETFENLGRSFVEVVKIYYGLGDPIVNAVEVQGIEHYQKVRQSGRAVIFITGHCGNWELLALALARSTDRIYVMARRQNNPYIDAMIVRARTRYGNTVIYKKDGLRKVLRALRAGDNIGILMDQAVVPSEGLPVEFLGHDAWTLKSPVVLAKKTGAALLPVFIRRQATGHLITIFPEVSLVKENSEEALRQDLRKLNAIIEEYILQNPSEWLWIHRRWKERKTQ